MTHPSLQSVPSGGAVPTPVSPGRIHGALMRLGRDPQFLPNSDTLQVTIEGLPVLFSLVDSLAALSVRCVWETEAPHSQAEEPLFAAADMWNRERSFPTIYIMDSDHETAQVVADYVVPCRVGLSEDQLEDAIRVGINTGTDAMRFMHGVAASILRLTDPPERQ